MSLKIKFLLFSSLLLAAVLIIMSVLLIAGQKKIFTKSMDASQQNMVTALARISEEAILTENDLLILGYTMLLKETVPALKYAMIMGPGGKILGHSDVTMWGTIDNTPAGLRARDAREFLRQTFYRDEVQIVEVSKPVYLEGLKVGIARLGYSQKKVNNILNSFLARSKVNIFIVSIFMFIIGIAGSLLLAKFIISPIQIIAAGAKKIGEGKLDTRIALVSSRKDELGWLAKQFNNMAVKLKELDEMKKDFVSSVTHELRSPLGAIESYINYIIENKKMDVSHLERIRENAARLKFFVNDLLDTAKIEKGKMEVEMMDIEIAPLLSDCLQSYAPLAAEKGISIKKDIAMNIPNVRADGERLRQVLVNLLSNALKFTPPDGEVILGVKDTDDEQIILYVRDTGTGIPADRKEKIFEKFEQVKGSSVKGTGLGLAIAKGIIDLHGGKIWVESEMGEGSTFYFTLEKSIKERVKGKGDRV